MSRTTYFALIAALTFFGIMGFVEAVMAGAYYAATFCYVGVALLVSRAWTEG